MPEQDHQFKRIEEKCDQIQADEKQAEDAIAKIEDKLKQFKWDDAEEEVGGEELIVSNEEIHECVFLLSDQLLANITGENFGGMDSSGMRFVIPVDLDMHQILQQRFEEKWTLDSRMDVFENLRSILSFSFSKKSENRAKLDAKIQEALPPTHRKKFTSGEVSLEGDAMVVDDESNMVSIEIPVHFVAN